MPHAKHRLLGKWRAALHSRLVAVAKAAAAVALIVAAAHAVLHFTGGEATASFSTYATMLARSGQAKPPFEKGALSLPERLAATYREYVEDMRAVQAQAEEDGSWSMPKECQEMIESMESRHTFYSELGQDLFLYKHFFPNGRDATGRKRFFLDIGANHPTSNSNTYFFEKCLGWEGVCVEANPDLANEFVGKRQCKLENVCVSNKATTLEFLKAGFMGHVVEGGDGASNGVRGADTVEIPCITITQLLAKYNVTHVDMLSIDIEAAEYAALSPLLRPDAKNITIDVVAAEVFWSDAQLRWLMSDLGFWKVTDIAHVDDIFVRVGSMDHATVGSREHYYQMMKDSQRQHRRPIIAPW